MSTPRLFIVAGPNGSGKSLFSKELTESSFEVFDGDKHMTNLAKQFPETGSEALWSYINEKVFEEEKQLAISKKLNYAFETNFRSDNPMKTSEEFRLSGYEVHLIFMGLDSIEESIQRVEQRVRLGGHKVDEESIRYNYKHGFANLYKYFRQFDSVTLYNNSISDKPEFVIPTEIGYFYQGKLELNNDIYPDWVKPIIDLFM